MGSFGRSLKNNAIGGKVQVTGVAEPDGTARAARQRTRGRPPPSVTQAGIRGRGARGGRGQEKGGRDGWRHGEPLCSLPSCHRLAPGWLLGSRRPVRRSRPAVAERLGRQGDEGCEAEQRAEEEREEQGAVKAEGLGEAA